ncbi:MAG: DUF1573 domain-containing protein [Desulfobacterales bacterium]|nr:DUF1573 domain-containing protein [Desulfobacterales bacterium]
MRCKSLFVIGVTFILLIIGCDKGIATSSNSLPESGTVRENKSEPSGKTPSITAPENSYEFSSVVDGVKVTHDFIVYNKGDGDLEISRVKTG